MPIYEYHCTACDQDSESLQKASDPPLVKCPHCGKNTLTKWVSAAGFQLKGSDWYITDYKNKKTAAKTEADGAKTADAKTAPSTETKPETKVEKKAETTEAK